MPPQESAPDLRNNVPSTLNGIFFLKINSKFVHTNIFWWILWNKHALFWAQIWIKMPYFYQLNPWPVKETDIIRQKKPTLWPLFMDGVQLPQG